MSLRHGGYMIQFQRRSSSARMLYLKKKNVGTRAEQRKKSSKIY